MTSAHAWLPFRTSVLTRPGAFTVPTLVLLLTSGTLAGDANLNRDGAFGFPQAQSQVLCDQDDLRLSAWSNGEYLYVQAVLWNDSDDAVGLVDGRESGDSAMIVLDLDGDGARTPTVDRSYSLSRSPDSRPGLHYQIIIDDRGSTPMFDDSHGRGEIEYPANSDGKRTRVDCFLIPLAELGKKLGDTVRLSYWGRSAKPELTANSIGYQSNEPYFPAALPLDKFHEFKLDDGPAIDPAVVPEGRKTTQGAAPAPASRTTSPDVVYPPAAELKARHFPRWLRIEAVQKELELTPAQMDEIRKLAVDASAEQVAQLLTKEQALRLNQIYWHYAGGFATRDREVANQLGLSEDQRSTIEALGRSLNSQLLSLSGQSADEHLRSMNEVKQIRDTRVAEILTREQNADLAELRGKPFDVNVLQLSSPSGRQRSPSGFATSGRASVPSTLRLLTMPSVQAELQLSDEAIEKLNTFNAQARIRIDTLRNEFPDAETSRGIRATADTIPRINESIRKRLELEQSTWPQVRALLTDQQMDRLVGLNIQYYQTRALLLEFVADRVGLNAEQKQAVDRARKVFDDFRAAPLFGADSGPAERQDAVQRRTALLADVNKLLESVLDDQLRSRLESLQGAKFEFPASFGPQSFPPSRSSSNFGPATNSRTGMSHAGPLGALVAMPQVRKELGLSPEVQQKIDHRLQESADKLREMIRSAITLRAGGDTTQWTDELRRNWHELVSKFTENQRQFETFLREALTKDQFDRLVGLLWQREDYAALFASPAAADSISLTNEQRTQVEQIRSRFYAEPVLANLIGSRLPSSTDAANLLTAEQKRSIESLKGKKFPFPETVDDLRREAREKPEAAAPTSSKTLRLVQNLSRDSLKGVVGLSISPDGRNMYAAAYVAATLHTLSIDPTSGKLTHIEELTDRQLLQGTTDFHLNLRGDLGVSVAFGAKAVALFRRDIESGKLSRLSSLDVKSPGVQGLAWPIRAAFARDGQFVYVADSGRSGSLLTPKGGATLVLRITDDRLEFVESFVSGTAFANARGIAMHPDDAHLFVASSDGSSVVVVKRDKETGKLELVQVVRSSDVDVDIVNGAMSVAVDNTGAFVYTLSGRFRGTGAIGVFGFGPTTGRIALIEKHAAGTTGLELFQGGNQLAISPNGERLYVVGTKSGTLSTLQRDPASGKLTPIETVAFRPEWKGSVAGIAVSPDSRFVYVSGAELDPSITVFEALP